MAFRSCPVCAGPTARERHTEPPTAPHWLVVISPLCQHPSSRQLPGQGLWSGTDRRPPPHTPHTGPLFWGLGVEATPWRLGAACSAAPSPSTPTRKWGPQAWPPPPPLSGRGLERLGTGWGFVGQSGFWGGSQAERMEGAPVGPSTQGSALCRPRESQKGPRFPAPALWLTSGAAGHWPGLPASRTAGGGGGGGGPGGQDRMWQRPLLLSDGAWEGGPSSEGRLWRPRGGRQRRGLVVGAGRVCSPLVSRAARGHSQHAPRRPPR